MSKPDCEKDMEAEGVKSGEEGSEEGEEEEEGEYVPEKILSEDLIEKICFKDVEFVRDFFLKNLDFKKARGGHYEQVTALSFALYELENFEMVKMLVEEIGVDVNQTSYHYIRHGIERCPIGAVVQVYLGAKTEEEFDECRKLLDYLISHGANINPNHNTVSYSPLMDAAGDSDSSIELVKILVERGATISLEGVGCGSGQFSYNPMYFAALCSRFDFCKYFLKKGCPVHFADILSCTQSIQYRTDEEEETLYQEMIMNDVAILLLLQQEFAYDCYMDSVWRSLSKIYVENDEFRRRLVYKFGDDPKFRFREVWSPENHKEYPKPFRKFVMMMIWIHQNSKSWIHTIPIEILIYHIIPYMNEYFVLLTFIKDIVKPERIRNNNDDDIFDEEGMEEEGEESLDFDDDSGL